ncbi:MAG: hypothetical protein WC998_08080 [Candidatus Paceibacterota bacterium]|jgi:hypothetical protein
MKIIAKRPFISSQKGIGNVPDGRILDVEDNYAKMLIKAGLAEEYSAGPSLVADRKTSFIHPVGVNTESGSSSQVDPVLKNQTAIKSRRGVRKTRTVK